MGLPSDAILSKTPREFSIMMSANVERTYDMYERMASQAMMNRAAYHKEKLRYNDLFKRPSGEIEERTADDIKQRQDDIMNRLSRFEQFADKFAENEREEETD